MFTMGITNTWTYRISFNEKNRMAFRHSLQAYSQDRGVWMHMTYFKPGQVKDAEARYRETMRGEDCHPNHLEFSINNLLELNEMIVADHPNKEISDMIEEVCHILNIQIKNP